MPLNIVHQEMPMMPLNKTSFGALGWNNEKFASQWNMKNGLSIIKNFLKDLTTESISRKYAMKKQKFNLPFLALTISNNFLLIEALITVFFILGRRKYSWSLIIKPTILKQQNNTKENQSTFDIRFFMM